MTGRLIDADALINEIIECRQGYIGTPDDVTNHDLQCDNAISWIDGAEIVDAVQVVRCEQCKYFGQNINPMYGFCCLSDLKMMNKDFCSMGVRKV